MTDNTNKLLFSAEYMNSGYAIPQYPVKADFPAMMYQDRMNIGEGPFDYLPATSGMHSGALPASESGHLPFQVQQQQQQQQTQQHEQQFFVPRLDQKPDTSISSCSSPVHYPPAPNQSSSSSTSSSASASSGLNGALLPCSPISASTTSASSPSPSMIHHTSFSNALSLAAPLSEGFYPEFLQYSREAYEQSTTGTNRKKRRPESSFSMTASSLPTSMAFSPSMSMETAPNDILQDEPASPQTGSCSTNTELRRQIHIQSEQKRRAQIKDGFEELRNELPSCLNKKMSKVALLHRTVQHIQHLKNTQMTVLAELERLVSENEQLRRFQEGVLQRQTLEKMYQINTL